VNGAVTANPRIYIAIGSGGFNVFNKHILTGFAHLELLRTRDPGNPFTIAVPGNLHRNGVAVPSARIARKH
jgi:hypothetical protein